jgi:hypothetical protein
MAFGTAKQPCSFAAPTSPAFPANGSTKTTTSSTAVATSDASRTSLGQSAVPSATGRGLRRKQSKLYLEGKDFRRFRKKVGHEANPDLGRQKARPPTSKVIAVGGEVFAKLMLSGATAARSGNRTGILSEW